MRARHVPSTITKVLLRVLSWGFVCHLVLAGGMAQAEQRPIDAEVLRTLPVKELTVFKDGHALVLHEGALPTDGTGNVLLDHLPTPIMGTFWPYVRDGGARLKAVVAGRHKVSSEHEAYSVQELIEANIGAQVFIRELSGVEYAAEILAIHKSPSDAAQPNQPGIVLLKRQEGVKALPLGQIRDVTFRAPPKAMLETTKERGFLKLVLDWAQETEGTAEVGMVYLQKGFRWIPTYRFDIGDNGKVRVELQAVLLNELVDVEGVTAHLVIGVPTFAFKDTLDPMALQETAAQLSQYFQERARTGYAFSNAVMTQHARMGEYRMSSPPPETPAGDYDAAELGQNEDLFIFTIEDVTLAKGERMVVPVAAYELPFEDVFTLDVPVAPPLEVRQQFNDQQQRELARLFAAPRVVHKIRLTNDSTYPITTAPALILRDGRLIAQGMTTYTALGAKSDLALTDAVDIKVMRSDRETKREPNALKWQSHAYARIDLEGRITLVNRRGTSVSIEVNRYVIGHVDSADRDGQWRQANLFDDLGGSGVYGQSDWWRWYRWPYYWSHVNGIGCVYWDVELEPGQQAELNSTWHYFWG